MELSNKEMLKLAPSIFAKSAIDGASSRYAFIPTIDVVDAMRDSGFAPVRAMQCRTRRPGYKDFTKHMIRFRSKQDIKRFPIVVGGNAHHFYKKGNEPQIVEVILTNAHDMTSAYRLDAGIFRFVCSNGLVMKSADFGSIYIRHYGDAIKEAVTGSKAIIAKAPLIAKKVDEWRRFALTEKQRLDFAEAALIMRYGAASPITPEALLAPRRPEDSEWNLWTTMNVVQENLIRGEVQGKSAAGRRIRTRAITSINSELSINQDVWALSEVMEEHCAATSVNGSIGSRLKSLFTEV